MPVIFSGGSGRKYSTFAAPVPATHYKMNFPGAF
jgi:hypothetical protein